MYRLQATPDSRWGASGNYGYGRAIPITFGEFAGYLESMRTPGLPLVELRTLDGSKMRASTGSSLYGAGSGCAANTSLRSVAAASNRFSGGMPNT